MSLKRQLPIPFDDEQVARFERIAAALSQRASGVRITRTSAIGVAVEKGAEQLERELGLLKVP